jgi:hypothetical protein
MDGDPNKQNKNNVEIETTFSDNIFIFLQFFLPFGYDGLFALIMKWTNSYWITDLIFYLISGFFFILYFTKNI